MKPLLRTRLLPGHLFFLVWISAAFARPAAEWKEYPYAEDGFAISAPAQPAVSKQTVQSRAGEVEVHYYAFSLPGNQGLFLGANALHKDDHRSPQQIVTDTKLGATSGVKARIVSETPIEISGYPGVQIEFEAAIYHGRARYYSVGRMIYQIMAISPVGAPLPSEGPRFFDSFRLLNTSR